MPCAPSPAPLLLLGRLDGRLYGSPARDIWLARSRIAAAAQIAGLAGVPVDPDDVLSWITGQTLPPRHTEGLNDPLSVASIMHFMLLAQDKRHDVVAKATLNTLRLLLDDRSEAELWGGDDLLRFGPAFREAAKRLSAPYRAPTLKAVAERLQEVHAQLEVAPVSGRSVSTIDGRTLTVDPRSFGTIWLLACHLPRALHAASITLQIIPSLVGLPKFIAGPASDLATLLEEMLGRAAAIGFADLERYEAIAIDLPKELGVTRRSKLPVLIRLQAAYPGLRVPAIARLLDISPQGAAKLARQAQEASDRAH